jgi:hypothetical protein
MTEITSKAAGPRLLNVVTGKGEDGKPIIGQQVIQPGQTLDVDLFKADEPATKAMFDSGDLVYGKPEDEATARSEADAKAEEERKAALKAEYDRGYAEGFKVGKKS